MLQGFAQASRRGVDVSRIFRHVDSTRLCPEGPGRREELGRGHGRLSRSITISHGFGWGRAAGVNVRLTMMW